MKEERKLFIILSLFYAITVVMLSCFFYSRSAEINMHKNDIKLINAAFSLESTVGEDFHNIYSRIKAPSALEYKRAVHKLNSRVKEKDVLYIYSMAMIGEKIYFIVSNETEDDIRRKTYSVFYNHYPDPPEKILEAFRSKKTVFSTYSNKWGSFRSVFIPRKNSAGKTYISAADIKLNDLNTLLRYSFLKSIGIGTIFLLPVFIGLWYHRKITKERECSLLHELYHDPLTGLYNRQRLLSQMSINRDRHLSGIMLDINSFTQINSMYGQNTGDKLLIEICSVIKPLLKKDMDFYKLNADEFLITTDILSKKKIISFTELILNEISQSSYFIDGSDLFINMRAGIAVNFSSLSNLVASANISRNLAKEEVRGYHIQQESTRLTKSYKKNFSILKEIREAIDDERIIPFYQPIVNTSSEKVERYEALIRMKRKNGDIVLPNEFLSIAKTAKLYPRLTKIMITKICETFSSRKGKVSINFSTSELLNDSVVKHLLCSIKEYRMAGKLIVEIVESESITKKRLVTKIISLLKSNGVEVAIDDFGSGYSNFNYLLELQADYIKIDGSLIEDIDNSRESRIIVKSIVSFAHKLNMKIIAEFVSNRKIFSIMKEMNIDYSQGFYLGVPSESLQKIHAKK